MTLRNQSAVSAAAFFEENGYAVIASDELGQRVREAQGDILQLLNVLFGPVTTLQQEFEKAFNSSVDDYLAAVRVLPRLRRVRELAYVAEVTSLMQELGFQCAMEPSEMVVHIQGDTLRIPGGYFGTLAHQDMTAFGSVPKLTSVWIPLVDITAETFPLELAIGAHRSGVFHTVPAQQVYAIPADVLPDLSFVPIAMTAGSALVFSGLMPHRSGGGTDGAFRLAFSYRLVEAADPNFFASRYKYTNPGAPKA